MTATTNEDQALQALQRVAERLARTFPGVPSYLRDMAVTAAEIEWDMLQDVMGNAMGGLVGGRTPTEAELWPMSVAALRAAMLHNGLWWPWPTDELPITHALVLAFPRKDAPWR